METKYIVNNLSGQTINGDLTINGDFVITGTTNIRPYKVYTALLTQSGGNDPLSTYSGGDPIIIGQTYQIIDNGGSGWDFTNIGAPNNDIGTYFVATGITPASWGIDSQLTYNTGAPVVTVLENTIGNIWFTYVDTGFYFIKSNGLFTIYKTTSLIGDGNSENNVGVNLVRSGFSSNEINIISTDISSQPGTYDYQLSNTTLEIRVYN